MQGYIGLGSNLGDPVAELRRAISELIGRRVEVPKRSSLYQTEPVDSLNPEWFVNAVAEVRFGGEPAELFAVCRSVEALQGRERGERNAPRTIDLDILLLGTSVLSTPELIVPHPRFHQRRFVLEPMVEIAPDVIHPVMGKTMRELLIDCRDASEVMRLEDAFA